jgi:DNA-binding MarR family transcriptional regulator
MKEIYFDTISLIERLHRLFLDVVDLELDRLSVRDINNIQALILYNIGHDQLTVGELTQRGYYLGSNVSYNLRKMLIYEYVVQTPSSHDRRSTYIKATEKGLALYEQLDEIFKKQADNFSQSVLDVEQAENLGNLLRKIEFFWKGAFSRG